jgi:hypothetical protein
LTWHDFPLYWKMENASESSIFPCSKNNYVQRQPTVR